MSEKSAFEQEVERIKGALKDVYDPEIGVSIVDMGLVRKVEEVEGEVHITIILTAPFCPLAGMIMEQARAAAQAVTTRTVRVTMGQERWNPAMMEDGERQRFGFG